MIHDIDVARHISDLMIELTQKIEESIHLVKDQCSEDEFKRYRLAAAYVLGYAYTDVMVPLYQEHPSLKPEGMP